MVSAMDKEIEVSMQTEHSPTTDEKGDCRRESQYPISDDH